MITRSSILVWRIPWTEEPGGLQPMQSQRVEHCWVTFKFIIYINFLVKDNYLSVLEPDWFAMWCQLLLYKNVNQLYAHTYSLCLAPASHPGPSHPSGSSQGSELSSLCYAAASHQLLISVHTSVPLPRPPFIPPILYPHALGLHSTSSSLFLPWK